MRDAAFYRSRNFVTKDAIHTGMNLNLNQLQPYPFQKLQQLFKGITPNPAYRRIDLHIGEPKHTTPGFYTSGLDRQFRWVGALPQHAGHSVIAQQHCGMVNATL